MRWSLVESQLVKLTPLFRLVGITFSIEKWKKRSHCLEACAGKGHFLSAPMDMDIDRLGITHCVFVSPSSCTSNK